MIVGSITVCGSGQVFVSLLRAVEDLEEVRRIREERPEATYIIHFDRDRIDLFSAEER